MTPDKQSRLLMRAISAERNKYCVCWCPCVCLLCVSMRENWKTSDHHWRNLV